MIPIPIPIAEPAKGKKRGALTSPPPARGADRAELLAWLTAQLRLPAALVRVERWGKTGATPVHLVLEDGRVVRYGEAGDLNRTDRLVEAVGYALGADAPQLPTFTKGDAQAVFLATLRAADVLEGLDAVEEARGWQTDLWRVVDVVETGDWDDPACRFGSLKRLETLPPFDSRAMRLAFEDGRYRIPAIRWSDGRTFVRVDRHCRLRARRARAGDRRRAGEGPHGGGRLGPLARRRAQAAGAPGRPAEPGAGERVRDRRGRRRGRRSGGVLECPNRYRARMPARAREWRVRPLEDNRGFAHQCWPEGT